MSRYEEYELYYGLMKCLILLLHADKMISTNFDSVNTFHHFRGGSEFSQY